MLQATIHSFSYPNTSETLVLENIAFSLQSGEHLSILGESGCGKSTLLHLIYGLLPLKNATIYWKEKQLLGANYSLIPGAYFMKMVSQEYELMPFTSVAENIAEHLSRNDLKSDQQRTNELLEVVGLTSFRDTRVKYLSGGQKQRVAIAKALAKKPELLLLDEPFNSIDNFAKNKLRRTLFQYLKKENITCIMATHDSEEALAFSDHLLIIEKGKMVAYDTPINVFNNANTEYIASFFGDVTVFKEAPFANGKNRYLPHQLMISQKKTAIKAIIDACYFMGTHYLLKGRTENNTTTIFLNHHLSISPKTAVYITSKLS